jgi:hypothetical protein
MLKYLSSPTLTISDQNDAQNEINHSDNADNLLSKMFSGLIVFAVSNISGLFKEYVSYNLTLDVSNSIRKHNLQLYVQCVEKGGALLRDKDFNTSKEGNLSYMIGPEVIEFAFSAVQSVLVQPSNVIICCYSGYAIYESLESNSAYNFLVMIGTFCLLSTLAVHFTNAKVQNLKLKEQDLVSEERTMLSQLTDPSFALKSSSERLDQLREDITHCKMNLTFYQLIPMFFAMAISNCILGLSQIFNFIKTDGHDPTPHLLAFAASVGNLLNFTVINSQMGVYLDRLVKFEELASSTADENHVELEIKESTIKQLGESTSLHYE